jgi:hypothetical protein
MADPDQLSALAGGLESWNAWRAAHPGATVDLSGADLRQLEFGLRPAVRRAGAEGLIPAGSSWSFIYNEIVGYDVMPLDLRGANLVGANLTGADLVMARCEGADFSGAVLDGADLHRADLRSARFADADLRHADVHAADISESVFLRTNVDDADFGYSSVYGVSVWNLSGIPRDETDLLITPVGEPRIRIDGLALAQIMHFLLQHEHARDLIDAVTHHLVLLLGNFKEDRKTVLDAVRQELRSIGFMPILFDFDGPSRKDTTGTIETLARLACFLTADLTDPSSVPHELATTVPFLRTTPVMLLRAKAATGYSMVADLTAYPWVLDVHQYESTATLIEELPELVGRAQALAARLQQKPET